MHIHLSMNISAPAAVLGLSPHRLMVSGYRVSIDAVARPSFGKLLHQIDQLLSALRFAGRKSVEIVDTCCGDGALLVTAAKRARALGFVAIEAKGFDAASDCVERAWARAAGTRDPAIGYTFLVLERDGHLPIDDGDADIVVGDPANRELGRIAARPAAIVGRRAPEDSI